MRAVTFFLPAARFVDFFAVDFFDTFVVFFLATFFVDFFAGLDFFLPAFFAAGAFLRVTFLREAFFAADLPADLRATVFFRPADFFFDTFFDGVVFLLTLRFLPVDFLLAAGFAEAAFLLLTPARFRFLLAAFLAGIFDSCRFEKNAGLYIAYPNMEAQFPGYFKGFRKMSLALARPLHIGLFAGPFRRPQQPFELLFGTDCPEPATIVLSGELHYTNPI